MVKRNEHFVLNGIEVKRCNDCGKVLPATLDYWYKATNRWDGITTNCRECRGSSYVDHNPKLTKVCIKCGRELKLSTQYFRRSSERTDGFESVCKECRGWKFTPIPKDGYKFCNRCDKEFPNTNEYFCENKKSHGGLTKTCRNCISEQSRQYYHQNIEHITQRNKKRYQDPNVKHHQRELIKKWEEKHPDKIHFYRHKRRMLENQLPSTLSANDWDRCKNYFGNRCAYCGKEAELTLDHFVPVSKSGELSINNIISACRSCNSSKGNKSFFLWYPKQTYYSKKREKRILGFLGYFGEIQQLAFI